MKIVKLTCLITLLAVTVTARESSVFDEQSEKLERWIEARKLISEERENWKVGQEMLKARIELVKGERDDLVSHTLKIRDGVWEADRELLDLRHNRELLKEATVGLTLVIHELEQRVTALMARTPAPIREHVKPLLQRIPQSRDSKISLSERFQNVIGVLNEVNKFARNITVESEVRELEGGRTAEVTAMYLGVGAGYYFNEKGGIAGYGFPGEQSWQWDADATLVQSVADAVMIFRNERPAAYIVLPVKVNP